MRIFHAVRLPSAQGFPWFGKLSRLSLPGDPPPAEPAKEQEGVYLVESGKAVFKPITTGLLGELAVEVTKGLAGGETLITGPFRELRGLKPGDAVREAKPDELAPPKS